MARGSCGSVWQKVWVCVERNSVWQEVSMGLCGKKLVWVYVARGWCGFWWKEVSVGFGGKRVSVGLCGKRLVWVCVARG